MRKVLVKNIPLFLFLWVLTLIFYFCTAGAGFVTDQVGWIQQYKELGWQGIFIGFHDNSLHYFYHLGGFITWKLFGLNGYGWMFTFVTLHCLVALMSYIVFKRLFSIAGIKKAQSIALAGSLIFLLSPYQTETLCWYACIHYPLCAFFLMTSFWYFLEYLETGRLRNTILFYLFFIAALFTLELSFSFPLVLAVFILLYPLSIVKMKNKLHLLGIFVLPMFACLVIYFLLSKLMLGSVTGHYGSNVHLNFSIPLIAGTLLKYCFKIFAFAHFLPFSKREALYLFCEKEKVGYIVAALLGLSSVLVFAFMNKINIRWKMAAMIFAFFVLALSVILNLYFVSVTMVEGDRFSYYAIIFAGQLIAFFCLTFLRSAGWLVLAAYLIISCWFLRDHTQRWKMNGEVQEKLIDNFKWYDARYIYILNLPDNFGGTYMYRDDEFAKSFSGFLKLKTGKDIIHKTSIICEYNMEHISDSVKVQRIGVDSVRVEFAQEGNWWWRAGIGASSYSTSDYELTMQEWGVNMIHFKHPEPGDVILYQCGKNWRVLK